VGQGPIDFRGLLDQVGRVAWRQLAEIIGDAQLSEGQDNVVWTCNCRVCTPSTQCALKSHMGNHCSLETIAQNSYVFLALSAGSAVLKQAGGPGNQDEDHGRVCEVASS
jgi:hypothetical protein